MEKTNFWVGFDFGAITCMSYFRNTTFWKKDVFEIVNKLRKADLLLQQTSLLPEAEVTDTAISKHMGGDFKTSNSNNLIIFRFVLITGCAKTNL